MAHEMDLRKSRRGEKVYVTNPSVENALANTKTGVRRISNNTGDKFMIVGEGGEIVAPVGFHQRIEVDKTQFVKLYVAGIRAFSELSKTTAKLFEMIINIIQDTPGSDEIFINPRMAQTYYDMGKTSYLKAMRELIAKQFLFESAKGENWYFINVDYIFNGNRLAFIKEVVMKDTPRKSKSKSAIEDPDQIKLTDFSNVF